MPTAMPKVGRDVLGQGFVLLPGRNGDPIPPTNIVVHQSTSVLFTYVATTTGKHSDATFLDGWILDERNE